VLWRGFRDFTQIFIGRNTKNRPEKARKDAFPAFGRTIPRKTGNSVGFELTGKIFAWYAIDTVKGRRPQKGGLKKSNWKGGVGMREKLVKALRLLIAFLLTLAFIIYFSPCVY